MSNTDIPAQRHKCKSHNNGYNSHIIMDKWSNNNGKSHIIREK